jgi:hypothetical protein
MNCVADAAVVFLLRCCWLRVHQPVRQCLGWLLLHAGQLDEAWAVYSKVSRSCACMRALRVN